MLSCVVLIVVLFVESYQLFSSLQILTAISRQREVVALERRYWDDVLKRHAGYRDAYFKAGVLSYQLGEKDRASKYIYKALEIDPEFEEGWNFVKKVGF